MARILAISSQVVYGSVGLSIITPTLQSLAHDVMALPTVLLSNHPGHPQVAGTHISPETLSAMIEALAANGWLAGIDAVLSGYLPTAAHVAVVAATMRRLHQTKLALPYLCDPVIGDWPKGRYIADEAACAIRDQLLPLATMLTPNAFELSWLTGHDIADEAAARSAILRLPAGLQTVATSVPMADGSPTLANVIVADGQARSVQVPKRTGVPHGTGDLLAALLCGHVLNGHSFSAAVDLAVHDVDRRIAASAGYDRLLINAR